MAAEISKKRALTGPLAAVVRWLCILIIVAGAIWALNVPQYFGKAVFAEQYYGIFLGLILVIGFLTIPFSSKASRTRVPWYDALLAAVGLGIGLYVTVTFPGYQSTAGLVTSERWILGCVAVILVLEASRRVVGWVLTGLALFFILYLRFGSVLPGILFTPGASWQRAFMYLYLDPSGIFGVPIAVVSTVVLAYILFGIVLFRTGGGRILTDFALAIFGRFTGGPAKVAVVASSLFGTISGSVAANVAVCGTVTIPLMKRIGFKPHIAGAVEAISGTGGQLMPPVMGAAAFIIAQFLNVAYAKVALAALIPSLLYYLALFIQVDLEARKAGLKGLPPELIPPLRPVLKACWTFILPLGFLVYMLFVLYWAPAKAALAASLLALLISCVRKQTRPGWHTLLDMVQDAGKTMLDIGIIGAVAGIVVGAVMLGGTIFSLTMATTGLAENMLLPLLAIVAVISLILGMGLPTTAIYVLVAILSAPILVQLGVDPMAAHLFVFYYALLCFITPPVAFGAFVGAAIAGADMMKTGWAATRMGFAAYFIPFVFVYSPALLLRGSLSWLVPELVTASVGILLLTVSANGYVFRPLGWLKRTLSLFAGLGLMIPMEGWGTVGLLSNGAGAAVALVLFLIELRWRSAAKRMALSKATS